MAYKKPISSSVLKVLGEFSSKCQAVPVEKIDVIITGDETIKGFCKAFIESVEAKNPLLAKQLDINEDELLSYTQALIRERVYRANNDKRANRQIRRVAVPAFIDYVLSAVGNVVIRDRGLQLVPMVDDEGTDDKGRGVGITDLLKTSEKIEACADDVAVVCGPIEKNEFGDKGVMTMALINGYIRGMERVDDVISQYVAYFLGNRITDKAMEKLYRITYDSVDDLNLALRYGSKALVEFK